MIDVQELLRVKEDDLARVQREIEALRTVAVLLTQPDDAEPFPSDADPEATGVQLEGSEGPGRCLTRRIFAQAGEAGPSPRLAWSCRRRIAAGLAVHRNFCRRKLNQLELNAAESLEPFQRSKDSRRYCGAGDACSVSIDSRAGAVCDRVDLCEK